MNDMDNDTDDDTDDMGEWHYVPNLINASYYGFVEKVWNRFKSEVSKNLAATITVM